MSSLWSNQRPPFHNCQISSPVYHPCYSPGRRLIHSEELLWNIRFKNTLNLCSDLTTYFLPGFMIFKYLRVGISGRFSLRKRLWKMSEGRGEDKIGGYQKEAYAAWREGWWGEIRWRKSESTWRKARWRAVKPGGVILPRNHHFAQQQSLWTLSQQKMWLEWREGVLLFWIINFVTDPRSLCGLFEWVKPGFIAAVYDI